MKPATPVTRMVMAEPGSPLQPFQKPGSLYAPVAGPCQPASGGLGRLFPVSDGRRKGAIPAAVRPFGKDALQGRSIMSRIAFSLLALALLAACGTYAPPGDHPAARSEEHTSELQSLMSISYAVFCLKKNKDHTKTK